MRVKASTSNAQRWRTGGLGRIIQSFTGLLAPLVDQLRRHVVSTSKLHLLDTAKLNGLDPEVYLRYVLEKIADHPVNGPQELLPWRVAVALPEQLGKA